MDSQRSRRKSIVKSTFDIRYPTPLLCSCKMLANIRVVVSEKKKSKGMLYYSCPTNQCGFFRWCNPESCYGLPTEGEEGSYSDFKGSVNSSYGGFDIPDRAPEELEVMSTGSETIHDFLATRYVPVAWVSYVFFLLVLIVLMIK